MDAGIRNNKTNRSTPQVDSSDDQDDDGIDTSELPVVEPNARAERSHSPYRDAAPVDFKRGTENEKVNR